MKRSIGVVAAVIFLGVGSALAVPAQKTPGTKVDVNVKVFGHDVVNAEFSNKSKMSDVHNELKLDNAQVINPSGNMDLGVLENKSGGEMRGVSNQLEITGNAPIINEGNTRIGSTNN